MLLFVFLNGVVFLFLLLTIYEQQILPDISAVGNVVRKKIPPLFLISFIAVAFIAELFLILHATTLVLAWYLIGVFSLLLLLHARLLSEKKSNSMKVISLNFAILLIALRLLFPFNQLTHIVFILFSIVWIGPLLTKINLVTKKRFIFISIIWFLYDIFFVWLSSTALSVNDRTQAVNFILGIQLNQSLIGAGDLLWINIFICTLKTKRAKVWSAVALVVINILYGWFDYIRGIDSFFPLLVLWVPIGLFIYFLFKGNGK